MIQLSATVEEWPIAGNFVIARGAKTKACVVVARAMLDGVTGVGECTPYPRYGESPEAVSALILAQQEIMTQSPTEARVRLLAMMKAGAARNALDCALWSLAARREHEPVWKLAGLPQPRPLQSAFTISLGAPDAMARAARAAARLPLLKIKLGGGDDPARISAVRAAAPDARLIVDANEAWRPEDWMRNLEACAHAGVELIEQPFPAGADKCLEDLERSIPVCADESVHDETELTAIGGKYDYINVKLDKAGGLTAAIALVEMARAQGLRIMMGCMVSTSLAMAPASLLAQSADYVDLDGPMHLAWDRDRPLLNADALLSPPVPEDWG